MEVNDKSRIAVKAFKESNKPSKGEPAIALKALLPQPLWVMTV
jgi:hypothetical protein